MLRLPQMIAAAGLLALGACTEGASSIQSSTRIYGYTTGDAGLAAGEGPVPVAITGAVPGITDLAPRMIAAMQRQDLQQQMTFAAGSGATASGYRVLAAFGAPSTDPCAVAAATATGEGTAGRFVFCSGNRPLSEAAGSLPPGNVDPATFDEFVRVAVRRLFPNVEPRRGGP